jgi:hypothetical protein
MWKAVLAGTTALAITGTSLVYAQQHHRGPDAGARWRPSQEDIAAFTDARIAALKAGLKLNADQEKNWASYESALREWAKSRAERANARGTEQRPADPVERLRRQADALSTAGASLKRLADAQEPLYKSLDDSQKQRFRALSRLLRGPNRFADARGGRDGRGWRGGDRFEQGPGKHGPRRMGGQDSDANGSGEKL